MKKLFGGLFVVMGLACLVTVGALTGCGGGDVFGLPEVVDTAGATAEVPKSPEELVAEILPEFPEMPLDEGPLELVDQVAVQQDGVYYFEKRYEYRDRGPGGDTIHHLSVQIGYDAVTDSGWSNISGDIVSKAPNANFSVSPIVSGVGDWLEGTRAVGRATVNIHFEGWFTGPNGEMTDEMGDAAEFPLSVNGSHFVNSFDLGLEPPYRTLAQVEFACNADYVPSQTIPSEEEGGLDMIIPAYGYAGCGTSGNGADIVGCGIHTNEVIVEDNNGGIDWSPMPWGLNVSFEFAVCEDYQEPGGYGDEGPSGGGGAPAPAPGGKA